MNRYVERLASARGSYLTTILSFLESTDEGDMTPEEFLRYVRSEMENYKKEGLDD